MEIGPGSNPLTLFQEWLAEAKAQPTIREATAMSIATANARGEVHVRVVLCKDWSEDGFTFFTNYQSQKGHDLDENPQIGAVFYWDPLFKQVKISGRVEKTTRAVSENYWASRPRESQLSQFISHQSETVPSREFLEDAWKKAEDEFKGREIPCPPHWGGYLIRPQRLEFWIGRAGRLHDRYQFTKSGSAWTFSRLSP